MERFFVKWLWVVMNDYYNVFEIGRLLRKSRDKFEDELNMVIWEEVMTMIFICYFWGMFFDIRLQFVE